MAQARHRPRRMAKDSNGTLSYQAIGAPHPGHAERGAHKLRRSGRRAMTTFRKLPSTRPKTTTTARAISEPVLRGHVACCGGMQLAQDRELFTHGLRVACLPVGEHEADAGLRSEWLLAGRTAELGDALVVTAYADERLGKIRARDDVVRVHCDGLLQVRHRLGKPVLLAQREPEIVQNAELDRAAVERAAQS